MKNLPQEKSCLPNGFTIFRMLIDKICHGVDIYRLVKRMTSISSITSKVSTINEYFKISTFFINEKSLGKLSFQYHLLLPQL